MTQRYYQSWSAYVPAVKHMWRFYVRHRDALLDELSDASRRAWSSCFRVYSRLPDQDKQIADAYFGTQWGESVKLSVPSAVIEKTVARICRLTAVQYGLADDTAGNANQDDAE